MKRLTPEDIIERDKKFKELAIRAQLKKLEALRLITRTEEQKYRDSNKIEFFKPYYYQQAVCDAFRQGANIVIQSLSNKIGKTALGACLVHSWAKGYEPWNPVPDTFEGAEIGRAHV